MKKIVFGLLLISYSLFALSVTSHGDVKFYKGNTIDRKSLESSLNSSHKGLMFFDTTLAKPIWYMGEVNHWVDVSGEKIEVDTTNPILSSVSQTFTTTVGTALSLQTVTATDDVDGNLSVSETGSVDFDKVGTYNITYTATDSSGNSSSIVHTYIVELLVDNNLVKNGSFNEGTSYWENLSINFSVENSKLRIESSVHTGRAVQYINFLANVTYKITGYKEGANSVVVVSSAKSGEYKRTKIDDNGNFEFLFTPTQAGIGQLWLRVDGDSDNTNIGYFDNISITKVSKIEPFISGKLYTVSDLERWRYNLANNIFVSTGGVYIESRNEYEKIKAYAEYFPYIPDSDIVLSGKGVTYDEEDKSTYYRWDQFGKFDFARDAAFVDLVEGTSLYTEKIKRLILAQVQEPGMDFSNRTLYPYHLKDGMWMYAEWAHRVLKTYDYLPEETFTEAEHGKIGNWFKAIADWCEYINTDRVFNGDVYSYRDMMPKNSVANVNSYRYKNPIIAYKDGHKFYPAGGFLNNRQFGITNFLAWVGVKYNNDTWKNIATQLVREYIAFHFDEDGYYAELERSNTSVPNYGLAYGASTLFNVAEIAHILYHDGHVNLFEYKTYANMNKDTGAVEVGNTEKSLEWIILKFKENFMLPNAPAIYPVKNTNETSDQIIHFCNNTDTSSISKQFIGRMPGVAGLLNRYYKNDLIKEIYNSSTGYGNMCGYSDATLNVALSRSLLFKYADIE